MPANPYNNLSTITIVSEGTGFSGAADDSSGWLYKASTADIRINSTGTGIDGTKHYRF
jgi:redox-sensitive bicupin YhaK (pirin superfamily)